MVSESISPLPGRLAAVRWSLRGNAADTFANAFRELAVRDLLTVERSVFDARAAFTRTVTRWRSLLRRELIYTDAPRDRDLLQPNR